MLVFFIFLSLVFIARSTFSIHAQSYEPTWESLDRRPLPGWYDRAKFGIFVHWGLYSVPSFKSEWFWWYWKGPEKHADFVNFMNDNFKPNFTYADFAPMFTAEFFDPDQWAEIFERSGAKYVVLTSKHHEGFTLWPSKYSWNWNSMDTGPHRDLVGALANSVRRKNLTFGLYYSQFEWFHPLWNKDAQNNFTTSFYPHSVSVPQMYELVNAYKPEVVWSDGDNGPDTYWQSKDFLAWLYNQSPVKDTVVVNDRWGFGVACKHGGYFTCDDRYSPDKLQPRKWENCMTVQASTWGFDRTAHLNQYLTEKDLVLSLVDTVSYGGNLLLNVGPTHDGRIEPIFEERLMQIGKWLSTNGESIYATKPWSVCQNDTLTPQIWYTSSATTASEFTGSDAECPFKKWKFCKKNKSDRKSAETIYATFFNWPSDGYLRLGCPEGGPMTKITMLGVNGTTLRWKFNSPGQQEGILVDLMPVTFDRLPSHTAWTLKMTSLKNS